MLNKDIKAKWIEALRSDKYTQGFGFLKTYSGCNCCLGVLAEINGEKSEQTSGSTYEGSFRYAFNSDDSEYSSVHQIPVGYCGIDRKVRDKLMDMNDGVGSDNRSYSFNEIADYIEEHL